MRCAAQQAASAAGRQRSTMADWQQAGQQRYRIEGDLLQLGLKT
jgi:hypothetical protein